MLPPNDIFRRYSTSLALLRAPVPYLCSPTNGSVVVLVSMGAVALAILGCMMLQSALASLAPARSFEIRDDQFFKDGKTFQIISGRCVDHCTAHSHAARSRSCGVDQRFTRRSPLPYSIHYFRCHPALWHDRLERVKALGLNAITASARIILCLACQRCLHGSAVWRILQVFSLWRHADPPRHHPP